MKSSGEELARMQDIRKVNKLAQKYQVYIQMLMSHDGSTAKVADFWSKSGKQLEHQYVIV